jgi:hypothetical protein
VSVGGRLTPMHMAGDVIGMPCIRCRRSRRRSTRRTILTRRRHPTTKSSRRWTLAAGRWSSRASRHVHVHVPGTACLPSLHPSTPRVSRWTRSAVHASPQFVNDALENAYLIRRAAAQDPAMSKYIRVCARDGQPTRDAVLMNARIANTQLCMHSAPCLPRG